jgi:hypothetical protein
MPAFPTHATSVGAYLTSRFGLAKDPQSFFAVVKAFGITRATTTAGSRLP